MESSSRSASRRGAIRIGVSGCLIGQEVRFNGGHCHDRFLTGAVGRHAEFVSVCPEMEIGLGTPRETLRLERRGDLVVLRAPKSGADLTETMTDYATNKARALARMDLSGFVLKKDSPSCGMERVKAYDENGVPSKTETGLFAKALMREMPLLPVEEEGRLHDPRLRENFLERVFAYRRLMDFFDGRWKAAELMRFHRAEKLLLLSHDPGRCRELGRLAASANSLEQEVLAGRYQTMFMEALCRPATVRRQASVLERVLGYVSDQLSAEERQEVLEVLADFRNGLAPLVTPLVLLRHYVRRFNVTYIADQTYLDPHPKELMLRSVV